MTDLDDRAVPLGADFPAVGRDEWLAAVRGVVLKGRSDVTEEEAAAAFARLVTVTEDGIELQPLYDADGAPATSGMPGAAPFVRGTSAGPRPWEIRQRVWSSVDGSSALTELESGATGVLVEVAADVGVDALDRLLDGVYLDLAPVSLASPPGDDGCGAARAVLGVWERRAIAVEERSGTLGVDPLGAWARTGGETDLDAAWARAAEVVGEAAAARRVRGVVVDGSLWHEAGASDGCELAWAIAAGASAVRSLVDAGVALDVALRTLEFRFAATADQFATITKLRAARRLWSRVVELAGADPSDAPMVQHADGSRVMLTRYDPWVNTLRSTVACFAGGVGGADAVTIWPHDVLVAPGGTALGRRIARNTQTVLQLESNLARVADMAGGSWYVEARTDALAEVAWAELQRIEAEGGIVAALRAGVVHDTLAELRAGRARALATRRRPLTGLTEYPDISEVPPPPIADAEPAVAGAFEPLGLHRLADDFERQRGRADAIERSGGVRPTVYLVTIGGPAVATTRATFAKNLFEVAGIRTVEGDADGYDPAVSPIVCLCSSDALYRERGAEVAAEMRRRGATTVYLAGRDAGVDGVDEEVGAASDVLDVLTRVLDRMGVPA